MQLDKIAISWRPIIHADFFFFSCAAYALNISLSRDFNSNLQAQRLPKTVVPTHYKLFLDPDIGQQKFTGEETINVHVQQVHQ